MHVSHIWLTYSLSKHPSSPPADILKLLKLKFHGPSLGSQDHGRGLPNLFIHSYVFAMKVANLNAIS